MENWHHTKSAGTTPFILFFFLRTLKRDRVSLWGWAILAGYTATLAGYSANAHGFAKAIELHSLRRIAVLTWFV